MSYYSIPLINSPQDTYNLVLVLLFALFSFLSFAF